MTDGGGPHPQPSAKGETGPQPPRVTLRQFFGRMAFDELTPFKWAPGADAGGAPGGQVP